MIQMRSLRVVLPVLVLAFVGQATAQKSKLNAGYAALSSAKFDVAVAQINEGLAGDDGKLKPADKAKAYVKLAEAYQLMGQMLTADKPMFPKMLEQFPDRNLKTYQALKKAEEFDVEKKFTKDIEQHYATAAGGLYSKGFDMYKAEKYDEALTYLNPALDIFQNMKDPNQQANLYAVYNLRTYVHLSAKDSAATLADAEKSLELLLANYKDDQADNAQILYRLIAELHRSYKKDLPKSIEVLEAARKRFPDSSELRDALLQSYAQLPDKSAVKDKLEAEYNAGNPSEVTILMLANLIERDEPDRALKLYQEAATLNPNRWESQYNIGVYYVNRAAALNEQSQATRDPKKLNALRDQAMAELRKAVPFMEKAHELNPAQYDVLDSLVRIYIFLNDPAKEKEYRAKRDSL